jgi:hypothetical protein
MIYVPTPSQRLLFPEKGLVVKIVDPSNIIAYSLYEWLYSEHSRILFLVSPEAANRCLLSLRVAKFPCKGFKEDWGSLQKGFAVLSSDEARSVFPGKASSGFDTLVYASDEDPSPGFASALRKMYGCTTLVVLREGGAK